MFLLQAPRFTVATVDEASSSAVQATDATVDEASGSAVQATDATVDEASSSAMQATDAVIEEGGSEFCGADYEFHVAQTTGIGATTQTQTPDTGTATVGDTLSVDPTMIRYFQILLQNDFN